MEQNGGTHWQTLSLSTIKRACESSLDSAGETRQPAKADCLEPSWLEGGAKGLNSGQPLSVTRSPAVSARMEAAVHTTQHQLDDKVCEGQAIWCG